MEIIFLFVGILTGAGFFWLRNKQITALTEKTKNELQAELQSVKNELEKKRNEITNSVKQSAMLQAENNFLKEKLEQQKTDYQQLGDRFSAEFKLLANQILEDKSKRFTEVNRLNIESLLNPLGKNIEEFKKRVEETYDKESKQRFSLEEKIKSLVELNIRISEDANNLTKALKGESKTQGDWGEMILENILEKSGLAKGREYFTQAYLSDEQGNPLKNAQGEKLRPDVIISYPDNRKVIIDSKVSLVSYERYNSTDSVEEQGKYLSDLIRSVRNHIDGLSGKSYQDFAASLDFVMMFIPIEPVYFLVMQKDPDMWNYAYSKRILLISPTNLIAALKMIQDLWKREYQNRNAMEIAERGGQLYDKFAGLWETLKILGESIDRVKKNYDSAVLQIKDGRGNLIGQVEKLKELGVKAKKSLPESLQE
jgi:DNA recombination protein RmuC